MDKKNMKADVKQNNNIKIRDFSDTLREDFLGQPIAIWCARYTYRGYVAEVGSNFVTLLNPKAVEATGEASGAQPTREDPIPSAVTISLAAVEQFCQPGWVAFGYNKEDNKDTVPNNKQRTYAELLREDFLGKPIAVWCARYTYRGILKEVGTDYITLSNPKAVEATGEATGAQPTREDNIPSDLTISLDAVEQHCQPTWVAHNLEVETKGGKK